MNRAIIFLGGFIGGAVLGWYAGSKIERTQCEAELKAAYQTYEKAMEKADKEKSEAIKKTAEAVEDREVFADALRRLGYSDDKKPTTKLEFDFSKIVDDHPREDEYHESDPALLEIPTEEEFRREEKLRSRPPEVIAETVYAEDFSEGYEQKDLLWYPEDRIMLDADNNEMVDNPYSFLGLEWERDIDIDSEYSIKGETYVRNYHWETDYFILQQNGKGSDNMSLGV